ncbi:hypothetical protein [Pararhodospirillum oryzae]|uniref:Uncharacterized protein n=1 Tax=Pararhodospirillum oryzae TaxID=478448 RepID=A0A512H9F4_9PROT|nr:hypothetical protein [Pararhodospirillum oryzae]GEO82048.1 hypothetical protein ROR02_21790 [Pararhodospirillum oryzae]
MSKKTVVHPGDRFVKPGNPPSQWQVDQMLEYPDLPAHVRLIELGGNRRTVTVALSALLDGRLYAPSQTQPPPSDT